MEWRAVASLRELTKREATRKREKDCIRCTYTVYIYICVFRFVASVSDLDWKLFSFKPTPRFLAGL